MNVMNILVTLMVVAVVSCVDDPLAEPNMPSLTISAPSVITRTSVTLNAEVNGDSHITEIGFIIGENSSLDGDVMQLKQPAESVTDRFSANLNDLEVGHTYFYAAYAKNGIQTVRSQVETFTTLTRVAATLSAPKIWVEDETTYASCTVLDDGGADIAALGFCFNQSGNPTVNKDDVIEASDYDRETGVFKVVLSDYLKSGKEYWIRGYADCNISDSGASSTISYGEEIRYQMSEFDPIHIPDANFKSYLLKRFDRNSDGEITPKEAEQITQIDVSPNNISSLKGVEMFGNLEYLDVEGELKEEWVEDEYGGWLDLVCTGQLTSLDIGWNTKLRELRCGYNQLETLVLPENSPLSAVYADRNYPLTDVTIGNCPSLSHLNLNQANVRSLDVSGCPNLGLLSCSGSFKTIDVSHNPELWYLMLSGDNLEGVELSRNTKLKELYLASFEHVIADLDLTSCTDLRKLDISGYAGETIDLSSNSKLISIQLSGAFPKSVYVWEGFEESQLTQANRIPDGARYIVAGTSFGGEDMSQ